MTLTIPADDHGQIRVFGYDGTLPDTDSPAAVAALLGSVALDMTYVDVVRIADLGGLRLTDYIKQGYDFDTDAGEAPVINAIKGYAILILSRATGGAEVTLAPAQGLRHVTTYVPAAQLQVTMPLHSDAAKSIIADNTKPPKSNARIGGMVATAALVFMLLFVGFIIWIAG